MLIALCLVLISEISLSALCAADAPAALDERAIDSLIAQLGSDEFSDRQKASENLLQAGPAIVPFLEKHRESGNPEVRARVEGIIRSFVWMQHGAIINTVLPDSQASRLGMQPGDVIVKIDDTPIVTFTDIAKVRGVAEPKSCLLFVWRTGSILKINVGEGLLGINFSNWDISKGGADHSLGLGEFVGVTPDLDRAYRRLRTARDHGMDDPFTLEVLACLAARALDGPYADECHKLGLAGIKGDPYSWEHVPPDPMKMLAFNSIQTPILLARYHSEPYAPKLAHELEDWFARPGRNSPMLPELLAKPWAEGETKWVYRFFHDAARLSLALHDRRYAEALDIWRQQRDTGRVNDFSQMAMQAAIRSGRSKEAVEIGRVMLDPTSFADGDTPRAALWSLASAAARDDQDSVDAFLGSLDGLSAEQLSSVGYSDSANALYQPAAARVIRKWLPGRPEAERPRVLVDIALTDLIADPSATVEEFNAAILNIEKNDRSLPGLRTLLTGYLRFNQLDKAEAIANRLAKDFKWQCQPAAQNARQVIEFVQKHQHELQGEWKQIGGCVEVLPLPKERVTWVLRYDGQVFRVGDDGKIDWVEGLPPPPAPVTVAFSHLWPRAGGVIALFPYGRRDAADESPAGGSLVYFLDSNARRWIPAAEYKGPADFEHQPRVEWALAEAEVNRSHPALAGGGPRMSYAEVPNFAWFEGDIQVYLDPKTHVAIDLSLEIGRLANRKEAAHVYSLDGVGRAQNLLFTDCGLWHFDPDTHKITRVPLGLPNENVMTCSLPLNYSRDFTKVALVGIAPQQGGKIFKIDQKTLAVIPTNGHCGLGPDDWFAEREGRWATVDPQQAIYADWISSRNPGGKK